jgi:tetratricopeptide (TPR) repeat protein
VRALAIVALLTTVAAAEPEAERLYKEGQAAYDAQRYDDALAAWTKSYELSHLPGLVFNIAQAQRLRGDCVKAVEAYNKFIALDPKSSERSTAEGFIKDLSPCPSPNDPTSGANTGAATSTSSNGPATSSHGSTTSSNHSASSSGGSNIVDTGHGKRIAGLAIAGGGLAIAATGLYFGSQAQSLGDEVRKACATGCAYPTIRDKDQEGHRDETIQWILYGAGAAAVVTGGILYLTGKRPSSVAVAPHGDGAVVSWIGRW